MIRNLEDKLKAKSLKLKANSGQLIIESMIGISIAVVGILGVLTLLSRSISLNRVVSDQFTGAYLAAEGVEITKNLIDANIIQSKPWNRGFSSGSFEADFNSMSLDPNQSRRLLFDSANNFYSYDSGNQTNFIRTINIQLIGSEEIKVNSIVNWTTRGGGKFEVNLENRFFNWRP
ncbi:MAG: hypothetical protein DDT18_01746 [Actinobacteria bacterium]|nr:hypothetical protein [Actinomycetota bacterium]